MKDTPIKKPTHNLSLKELLEYTKIVEPEEKE